jgi:hypothetical protein
MNTRAQVTQLQTKESNHIWKEATQQSTHTAQQVHVCTPKQTLPFPLQYKLANARQPVYLFTFLVV